MDSPKISWCSVEIETPELGPSHRSLILDTLTSRVSDLRVRLVEKKEAPDLLLLKTYVPNGHNDLPFESTDFSNPHGDVGERKLRQTIEALLSELDLKIFPRWQPVRVNVNGKRVGG